MAENTAGDSAELSDLLGWLEEQIDGGLECRGRDGTISHHIRTVEAAIAKLPCGHHASLLVRSVESGYKYCDLCECRKQRNDAEQMERAHQARIESLEREVAAEKRGNDQVVANMLSGDQDPMELVHALSRRVTAQMEMVADYEAVVGAAKEVAQEAQAALANLQEFARPLLHRAETSELAEADADRRAERAEAALAISAQQVESLAASLRQAEAERDALREDAERWDCIVFHWQHGEVTLECDDQGYFVLQSDPAEFAQQVFRGDCPDAAIDAARKEKR